MIVFAGPSGSGKNTVISSLLERCGGSEKLVTATTRKPRPHEKPGVDHVYMSNGQFVEAIERGLIGEYVHFEERDVYYGTLITQLKQQLDRTDLLIAEVQIVGARYFKEHYNALTIFIEPESMEVLERRIRGRSKLDEFEIKNRLEIAEKEIREEAPFYDIRIANRDGELESTIERILYIFSEYGITCRSV